MVNCTPLIGASYNGHLECVKYLCEQSDSQGNLHNYLNIKNKHFGSALSCAVIKCHTDCADFLRNVMENGMELGPKFAGKN